MEDSESPTVLTPFGEFGVNRYQPKKPWKFGYVYVIDYGDGQKFKIGSTTKTPEVRLGQISRNVLMPMYLVMGFSTDSCRYLEAMLHMLFDLYHVEGEWFELDFVQLVELYQAAKPFGEAEMYQRWYDLVPEDCEPLLYEHIISPVMPPLAPPTHSMSSMQIAPADPRKAHRDTVAKLYYQAIKSLDVPVGNHNVIRAKITEMAGDPEKVKIINYLKFVRDQYVHLDWKFKPHINEALDIYRKRAAIRTTFKRHISVTHGNVTVIA